jgi:hypothetical protein
MIQRTERAPSSVSPAACAVVVVVVVADMKAEAAERASRPSRARWTPNGAALIIQKIQTGEAGRF